MISSFLFAVISSTDAVAETNLYQQGIIDRGDGYVVRIAGSMEKIPRKPDQELGELPEVNAINLAAARREAESFQVTLTSGKKSPVNLKNISITALMGPDNTVLPKESISVNAVGYVNGNAPDVLFPLNEVMEEYKTVHPGENLTFWFTVDVPSRSGNRELPTGTYNGVVKVDTDQETHKLPVRLRVRPFALPEKTTVWTQLFPIHDRQIQEYYDFSAGSDAYRKLFGTAMDHLRNARISPEWPTPVAPRTRFYTQALPRRTGDGRHGSAFSFDDLGLVMPDSSQLHAPRMTVSAWVYPERASHDYPIVWKRTNGDAAKGGFSLRLRVVNGGKAKKLHVWLDVGKGKPVHLQVGGFGEPDTPIWNQWYHVAMTYDGEKVKAYIDGVLAGSTEASGRIQPADTPLKIGAYGRQHEKDHYGKLDEVRLYNRALTPAEIRQDLHTKNAPFKTLADWGFEKFDDRPGRMLRYLPDSHICSDKAVEWYMNWAEKWRNSGLYIGRLPMPYTDRRTAELFVEQYVRPLKERGWLDKTYVRLPDEGFYPNTEDKKRGIRGGTMINEIYPEILTHMTFNGLFYKKDNPELKIRTLRAFEPATDIWSINPSESHLPGVSDVVREFFRERPASVSWYIHHHLKITDPAKTVRGFFTKMWQERIHQLTLWNTMIWDRTNPKRVRRGYDQDGIGGNGLLFWPGENQIHSSIRVEQIRDGIEDWLYYQKLNRLSARSGDLPAPLKAKIKNTVDRSLIEGMHGLRYWLEDKRSLIEHRETVSQLIGKLLETTNR